MIEVDKLTFEKLIYIHDVNCDARGLTPKSGMSFFRRARERDCCLLYTDTPFIS